MTGYVKPTQVLTGVKADAETLRKRQEAIAKRRSATANPKAAVKPKSKPKPKLIKRKRPAKDEPSTTGGDDDGIAPVAKKAKPLTGADE